MLIQTNDDIIEILNDDILFIVKRDNNQDEDWMSHLFDQKKWSANIWKDDESQFRTLFKIYNESRKMEIIKIESKFFII